ncbi:MAG: hypothetical protein F6K10_38550, partial [Moorea sp. SIO2B7]|nr:hypothetical protein [Moorena sp. SIO2B7]
MSRENSNHIQLSIDKIYPYAFVVILIFALIIGLIGLNKGLWHDEYFTIRKISHASLFEMYQDLKEDIHPHLYYTLFYFLAKFSRTEEFLRFFNVLLNLGTIGIVIIWIKPYSSLASLLAGIYLATIPIMLRYSQEIKAYPLLLLSTAIAFLFASYIIAKPERYLGYLVCSLSLTVAISSNLAGIMLIPSILVFIAIMAFIYKKRVQLVKMIPLIFIPTMTFIYFNFFWLEKLEDIKDTWWWMPPISLHLISSTAKYLFGLSSLYLPDYLIPLVTLIFFALLAIAFGFGKWKISFPFLIAAIIFWVEIIIYSVVESPIFYYRTLLPGLIPFIAFISLQIATIEKKEIKRVGIICLTILSLIYTGNWITNQAHKPVEPYKQVGKGVESQWDSN